MERRKNLSVLKNSYVVIIKNRLLKMQKHLIIGC